MTNAAWEAAVVVLTELASDDPDYYRINEAGKAILSHARRRMELPDDRGEVAADA